MERANRAAGRRALNECLHNLNMKGHQTSVKFNHAMASIRQMVPDALMDMPLQHKLKKLGTAPANG